ncbi:putative transaldolase [Diplodia seriata]|uniref:Putative transaldolase n=1 Tax=Diplodia seriata TaxID=420778 RepID=A0A0G2GV03_9PEZI|nr:putative transaldolase [Diplodia seriata]
MPPPSSSLDPLRAHTTIVADTGDFNVLSLYRSQDATTNSSHILAASQRPEYAHLLHAAVAHARADTTSSDPAAQVDAALLHLLVSFGCEILRHVPGRVSTEVDPSLSFDAAATVAYARRIVAAYGARGVGRERVLVKIPATWEGFLAVEALEREGIRCNVTLLFGLRPQAMRAAEELKGEEVEMRPVLVREKVAKQDASVKVKSYADDEAAFRTDLFNDHAAHDKMTDMLRQFLRDGAATKAALKELLQSS